MKLIKLWVALRPSPTIVNNSLTLLTVCRSTLDICTLERERTHETSLVLGPDPARSLFLLVTVTGTTPALPPPRPGPRDRAPAPGLLEPSLGSLAVIVRGAEGLPKTSGVGSNLYCVLELDNSRLETQGVHRAANPTWNKMINFEIKVKW